MKKVGKVAMAIFGVLLPAWGEVALLCTPFQENFEVIKHGKVTDKFHGKFKRPTLKIFQKGHSIYYTARGITSELKPLGEGFWGELYFLEKTPGGNWNLFTLFPPTKEGMFLIISKAHFIVPGVIMRVQTIFKCNPL